MGGGKKKSKSSSTDSEAGSPTSNVCNISRVVNFKRRRDKLLFALNDLVKETKDDLAQKAERDIKFLLAKLDDLFSQLASVDDSLLSIIEDASEVDDLLSDQLEIREHCLSFRLLCNEVLSAFPQASPAQLPGTSRQSPVLVSRMHDLQLSPCPSSDPVVSFSTVSRPLLVSTDAPRMATSSCVLDSAHHFHPQAHSLSFSPYGRPDNLQSLPGGALSEAVVSDGRSVLGDSPISCPFSSASAQSQFYTRDNQRHLEISRHVTQTDSHSVRQFAPPTSVSFTSGEIRQGRHNHHVSGFPLGDSESSQHRDSSNQASFHRGLQGVKISKMVIPKFSGNHLEFGGFWDRFSVAFHENPSLSAVEKFVYLLGYLEGEAASCIKYLPLTAENYAHAVEMLLRRFGGKIPRINAHMHSLLELPVAHDGANPSVLRHLVDKMEGHVRALKGLGVSLDGDISPILGPVLFSRLPSDIRIEWTRRNEGDAMTVTQLLSFLQREVETRERASSVRMKFSDSALQSFPTSSKSFKGQPAKHRPTAAFAATVSVASSSQGHSTSARTSHPPCCFCAKNHHPSWCFKLKSITAKQAIEAVKKAGRCLKCMGPHLAEDCKRKMECKKCNGGPHHPKLCEVLSPPTPSSSSPVNASSTFSGHAGAFHPRNNSTVILMQTAVALAYGPEKSTKIRRLFDSASERSYVTTSLISKLELAQVGEEMVSIQTFGGGSTPISRKARFSLTLSSAEEEPSCFYDIQALEIDAISEKCHSSISDNYLKSLPYLRNLKLADPPANEDLPIDLLIGEDFYWTLVGERIIKPPDGQGPVALASCLGYILSGLTSIFSEESSQVSSFLTLTEGSIPHRSLNSSLESFWKLESLGITACEPKLEEHVLEKFKGTTSYKGSFYEVKLPWRTEPAPLDDNFKVAEKRLYRLETKLCANPSLHQSYAEAIAEFEELDFIEEVPPSEFKTSCGPIYYLPHRPVVRESSSKTKIRPVFDASCKSPSGYSLNDCLWTSPPLQPEIFDILLRFRFHQYAFTADIRKAFLMISIHPDDRDCCRFLWRLPESKELITYRFKKLAFGLTSSPFLLNATIKHHLTMQPFSPAVDGLLQNLFVDDFVDGGETMSELVEKAVGAFKILKSAGMELREWCSNSECLKNHLVDEGVPLRSDPVSKTLGIVWDSINDVVRIPAVDCFKYSFVTKRQAVSHISKAFDPLGLCGLVLISAKIFLQKIWKGQYGWDDWLGTDLTSEFLKVAESLSSLQDVQFPRWLLTSPSAQQKPSLHLFCDASPQAYAACLYVCQEVHGVYYCNLLVSKSRVSPIKTLTLPRLELLSCLIGARLVSKVTAAVSALQDTRLFCWSDSQIALAWIANPVKSKEVFVSNRSIEISRLLPDVKWNYVVSKDNPADLCTRQGCTTLELSESELWKHGPHWVCEDLSLWPNKVVDLKVSSTEVLLVKESSPEKRLACLNPERFSNLQSLLGTIVFLFRFGCISWRRNKDIHSSPMPSVNELDIALNSLIKLLQQDVFAKDYVSLETQTKLLPGSQLHNLHPVLDDSSIIRSIGRNSRSDEIADLIILPLKHVVTELIIRDIRERNFHSGVNSTLASCRQHYWIIAGRQNVKKVINKCAFCRRFRSQPYTTDESALPKFRVNKETPFFHTGVDFCGPFNLHNGDKPSVALFTCAVTRAIHLEVVNDLSLNSFMLCFKRFQARRGQCRYIFSDNAKTFKSPSKSLVQQVTWYFIPDRAPHWAGFWERMVRCVKGALRNVLKSSSVTLVDFQTTITEVEAVVNRRPLTYLSDDATDPVPLRPVDFLIVDGHVPRKVKQDDQYLREKFEACM